MSADNSTDIGAEVSVLLTQEEIIDYEVAASEVEYLLISAASIFDMLQSGFSVGALNPESQGVIGMIEMVGRGFNDAAEKEGVAMSQLSGKLRDASKSARTTKCL